MFEVLFAIFWTGWNFQCFLQNDIKHEINFNIKDFNPIFHPDQHKVAVQHHPRLCARSLQVVISYFNGNCVKATEVERFTRYISLSESKSSIHSLLHIEFSLSVLLIFPKISRSSLPAVCPLVVVDGRGPATG